jgi:hypothetical protein
VVGAVRVSDVRVEGRWQARPGLAVLLRLAILGVPVLVGSLLARGLAENVHISSVRWVSALVLVAVAVLASVLVSRVTNRLMPLAVLLKMTMIFPDRAPSRLKVARRTTSLADIKRRLDSPRLDEQDAAATMLALVTALGRHDRHTRGHSERVRLFCDLLSKELTLSAADTGRLRWAALVHDIGKLQIPVAVLNKPGKLNEKEWDLIRQHPDAGAKLAAPLKEWLGPWYAGIAEHHERYDGTGYPRGLAATAISPAGRAIAVVDAFETMTASRSYKSARSTLSARAELTRCAGSHFDPAMVRAFLGIALPRLLWSVGPLAFIVNVPSLQWIGTSGVRVGNVLGATTTGAANAAGLTAVAMAVSASPTAAASAAPSVQPRQIVTAVSPSTPDRSTGGSAGQTASRPTGQSLAARPPSAAKKASPVAPKKQPVPKPGMTPAPPAKKTVPPPKKAAPPAKKAAPPAKKTAPPPKPPAPVKAEKDKAKAPKGHDNKNKLKNAKHGGRGKS